MSFSLVHVSLPLPCSSPTFSSLRSSCGLLISPSPTSCSCWVFVAPFDYDHPLPSLMSSLLALAKLPERVSVYAAFQNGLTNFAAHRAELEKYSNIPGVSVVVCREADRACVLLYCGACWCVLVRE